jgi:hypothetical protein
MLWDVSQPARPVELTRLGLPNTAELALDAGFLYGVSDDALGLPRLWLVPLANAAGGPVASAPLANAAKSAVAVAGGVAVLTHQAGLYWFLPRLHEPRRLWLPRVGG